MLGEEEWRSVVHTLLQLLEDVMAAVAPPLSRRFFVGDADNPLFLLRCCRQRR